MKPPYLKLIVVLLLLSGVIYSLQKHYFHGAEPEQGYGRAGDIKSISNVEQILTCIDIYRVEFDEKYPPNRYVLIHSQNLPNEVFFTNEEPQIEYYSPKWPISDDGPQGIVFDSTKNQVGYTSGEMKIFSSEDFQSARYQAIRRETGALPAIPIFKQLYAAVVTYRTDFDNSYPPNLDVLFETQNLPSELRYTNQLKPYYYRRPTVEEAKQANCPIVFDPYTFRVGFANGALKSFTNKEFEALYSRYLPALENSAK